VEVLLGEAGTAARTLLVLWDVDHTLIENNGVNKETYAYAFELLTGRPEGTMIVALYPDALPARMRDVERALRAGSTDTWTK
jgi:hypothetical protein